MANGIPALPGVPTVGTALKSGLGYAEGKLWQIIKGQQTWGIFNAKNEAICKFDSVVDVGWRNDSKITTAPVQGGAFASYNKVHSPYDATLRLSKGGKEADRIAFLAAIEKAGEGTDLYTIVTPEKTYTNANIVQIGYERRADSGANMLIVDVGLTEIREVTPAYTAAERTKNAKNDAAKSPENQGKVQPKVPESLLSKLASSLGLK
jgi:hypothetical protein